MCVYHQWGYHEWNQFNFLPQGCVCLGEVVVVKQPLKLRVQLSERGWQGSGECVMEAGGPEADPGEGVSNLWDLVPPMRQKPGWEEVRAVRDGVGDTGHRAVESPLSPALLSHITRRGLKRESQRRLPCRRSVHKPRRCGPTVASAALPGMNQLHRR